MRGDARVKQDYIMNREERPKKRTFWVIFERVIANLSRVNCWLFLQGHHRYIFHGNEWGNVGKYIIKSMTSFTTLRFL